MMYSNCPTVLQMASYIKFVQVQVNCQMERKISRNENPIKGTAKLQGKYLSFGSDGKQSLFSYFGARKYLVGNETNTHIKGVGVQQASAMLSIITYGLVPMRTKKQAFYHTHTTKNSFVLPRRCSKRPFLLSFLFPFFHLISKEVCGTFKTPLHFYFQKFCFSQCLGQQKLKGYRISFLHLLKFSPFFLKEKG